MYIDKAIVSILYKVIITVGIVGFNILYTEDLNYFWVSLYLWVNIGFFVLSELCQNRKTKNIICGIQLGILIFFTSKNVKLSIIFIAIFVIERIKFNVWGNLTVTLVAIISSFVIMNLTEIFFYLYSVITYFLATYFQAFYKEKIKKIEALESLERKELLRIKNDSKRSKEKSKQNIKLARLEERNELGRKMHDRIGHTIAGSLLRLEATKIIMEVDKDRGNVMLDEVIENLRTGMEDIRDIIHKTAPLKEEIGINRIRNILMEKLSNTQINYEMEFDGDLSVISYKLWNTIEDFVVEMSTNAIKYSECSKMNFHVNIMHKMIKVQFSDNGIGTDKIIKGYGLSKIEEEITSLGGKFILDGKYGFSGIILINRG
ncbi:MAG: sensor histidine kinase [Sarcina sp.]